MSTSILDKIRDSCRWVAERASFVTIRQDRIEAYAAGLPSPPLDPEPAHELTHAERQAAAAFWLTLDAINFGSGWFPTLKKRPGQSGYHTIHAGLRDRFDRFAPWSSRELTELTPAELAATFDQDPDHDLMALFAASLHDLGNRLTARFTGAFTGPIDAADGSVEGFVGLLAGWGCFADTSSWGGRQIPFLKRAQIAAADLHRAGAARFNDLHRLTMFADNLVPHVLRLDGILEFDSQLVARIDRHELIEHGSPEEVEIRACAVQAVELIVAASRGNPTAAALDQLLWQRGQQAYYKAAPRHRCRCTAY